MALSWDGYIMLSPDALSLVESFRLWRCGEKAARLPLRPLSCPCSLVSVHPALFVCVWVASPHDQFHTIPETIWPFFPDPLHLISDSGNVVQTDCSKCAK